MLEKHVTETLLQLTVGTQFLFSLTVLVKLALNVGICEPATFNGLADFMIPPLLHFRNVGLKAPLQGVTLRLMLTFSSLVDHNVTIFIAFSSRIVHTSRLP